MTVINCNLQNRNIQFKNSAQKLNSYVPNSKKHIKSVKLRKTQQKSFQIQAQTGAGTPPPPPQNPYYKETGEEGQGGDDSEQNILSKVRWKGWEDRVAADPQFVYKVLVEQILGVGFSLVGDMAARPNWGLNELEFVFCTFVVCNLINFSLMYILAPTASTAGVRYSQLNLVQKFFSEQTLKNWGAPGGNMYEPGFPLAKRAINYFYKGAIFAVIGFGAGILGTGASNGLIELRKKLDKNFEAGHDSPNILANAGTWAVNMGVSSNLRYQTLNGLDLIVQKMIPGNLFRVYSIVIRTGNNVLGGTSFVFFAKLFGVQKSEEAPAVESSETTKVVEKKNKKGR